MFRWFVRNLLFLYVINEVEFGQDILQGYVSSYHLYVWFFVNLDDIFVTICTSFRKHCDFHPIYSQRKNGSTTWTATRPHIHEGVAPRNLWPPFPVAVSDFRYPDEQEQTGDGKDFTVKPSDDSLIALVEDFSQALLGFVNWSLPPSRDGRPRWRRVADLAGANGSSKQAGRL